MDKCGQTLGRTRSPFRVDGISVIEDLAAILTATPRDAESLEGTAADNGRREIGRMRDVMRWNETQRRVLENRILLHAAHLRRLRLSVKWSAFEGNIPVDSSPLVVHTRARKYAGTLAVELPNTRPSPAVCSEKLGCAVRHPSLFRDTARGSCLLQQRSRPHVLDTRR